MKAVSPPVMETCASLFPPSTISVKYSRVPSVTSVVMTELLRFVAFKRPSLTSVAEPVTLGSGADRKAK